MYYETCPHDDNPNWCPPCQNAKRGKTRVKADKVKGGFRARYDGYCPECNLPISVGQVCVKLESGAVVHDDCSL